MANVNVIPEGLVPELGDVWTFITLSRSVFGKIIYRDDAMIRIQQYNGSMAAVEFPLDSATGFFLEHLGVTDIICHEKRSNPHLSIQLGVVEGEGLELYTPEGEPIDPEKTHTVARVIAEEDADALVLEDGTTLDFGFIGAPVGIGVITIAPAEDAEAENNSALLSADVEAEEAEAFPAFDESLLPAALVEEIPTEERMYSDTIQRTDMFTSLFMDIPTRKQKDPKVMARLYRITDLLLALKNSVVVRDSSEAIIVGQQESYIAETVEESLAKQPTGAPIASLLPVAAVKRVIYTDDVSGELEDKGDVESRSDISSLVGALQATSVYNTGEGAFVAYINTLMKTVEVFKASGAGSEKISVDQDVLRTQLPADPLMGLKGVPAARDPRTGEAQPLFADRHITAVKDRSVRLLSASRIRNPITGTSYLVAAADSGATVGHVILDSDLSKYRSSTRSSVLLWDVLASESSRKIQTLFVPALLENLEEQIIITQDDEKNTSLSEQLEARLYPTYNIINRHTVTIMDSLGLRNLEVSGIQFAHLQKAIKDGTEKWSLALESLKKKAATREAVKQGVAIEGIVTAESPLISEGTLTETTLKPVVDDIDAGNAGSTLDKYDLVYANDLFKHANYTLGPYYLTLAGGGAEAERLEKTRRDYKNESDRLSRNKVTALNLSIEFTAEPELIECPHVDALEKVYNIREDDKRIIGLDKVVKKYNGGQMGNFLLCGTCGNHLICKHELLLINEFFHPGRSVALHKSLLLEFGNGVFEGAYICKNCGQRISELEYDTHLEFDDNGRPLVGRSVVEAAEEDEEVVIRDETDAAIPFTNEVDKGFYKLARSMFERIGLQATEEMYKRAVPAARRYMETMVTKKSRYDRKRDELIAARKQAPVEYKHYYADSLTGVISALVLLEFQTSSIEIPLPIPGVDFSRDGFPVDGEDWKVVGMGALDYVTFGLAGLFINTVPWKDTTWAGVANPKTRKNFAKTAIMNGLYGILALPTPAIPSPIPLGTFTKTYKRQLTAWREKKKSEVSGTTGVAGASAADRLPPIFRPLNRLVAPPSVPAIGNRAAFEAQVQTGDFVEVAPAVVGRSHVLAQQIMNSFHTAAASSAVVVAGSLRSDSSCCAARMGDVAKRGLGVASLGLDAALTTELQVHGRAAAVLSARDPAAPAAGTHIYVPWNAPYLSTVLPAPKEEDYYKLFLKNCFEGDNMGLPHELSPDYSCRHCGYEYPEQLLYSIGSEIPINADDKKRVAMMEALSSQYTALAREALAASVTIDEEKFRALEAAVRERRLVSPTIPPAVIPFLNRLPALGEDLGFLLPAARADWTMVTGVLTDLAARKVYLEDERRESLAPFAIRYDALLTEMRATLLTAALEADRPFVGAALESLGKITTNPVGAVNARNVQQLFVVYGEQIADNYNNKDPKPSKWFAKISSSHEALVQRIWNSVAEITTKRLTEMKSLSPAITEIIRTVLRRFTAWLGRWMSVWINEFRPSSYATEKELTLLLRWTVLSGLTALLSRTSPLYEGTVGTAARTTCVRFLASWVLDALVTAGQRVDTYQLTAEQIAEKLNERAEAERAAFLRKFDELDLDDRKVELIKKKLKIGDWSVGSTGKMFTYNADMFEFEREQRAAFGVPDFDESITGIRGGRGEQGGEVYGFKHSVEEGANMDNNLLDVDDGERDERD